MASLIPSFGKGLFTVDDPFRAMRREMENMFGDFGHRWLNTEFGPTPALNVSESDGEMDVTVEIPGVDEKDIKVSVENNRLIISGEKKSDTERKDKNWHVVERSYGAFHRAVTLPFEPATDAVSAFYDKGILHLKIKKPAEAKLAGTKTIAIQKGTPPADAPAAATKPASKAS